MEIVKQLALLLFGFFILIKGADWFTGGASSIASRFGIPRLVIGLTIVAMGTSLPEAAISISAALKGSSGIAVGNVLGSNILNILLILGISALLCPISVERSVTRREIPFLLLITILLPCLGLSDGTLGRLDGILLLLIFAAYLFWLFKSSVKSEAARDDEASSRPASLVKACAAVAVGGALVILGSNLAVDSASAIAGALGMNDRLIGLTIVAIGTSLPELVTSSMAARKGEADMALGNIIGSNLFNILFVLGSSAAITPIAYPGTFLTDSLIAIAAGMLLMSLLIKDMKLQRSNGIIMLVGFALYYALIFLT